LTLNSGEGFGMGTELKFDVPANLMQLYALRLSLAL
jgi:hypothetical protein